MALPRFFGRAYLGAISGFQMMILVIASTIEASFLAIFKDKLGSYQPGLYGCLIIGDFDFNSHLFCPLSSQI